MQVEENVLLSEYTTFHIGGPARHFVRVASLEALQEALALAEEKKLTILLLGGGSNMLVSDAGFDGLVIKIEVMGFEVQENGEGGSMVVAGAGEGWDALVAHTVEQGWWGLENLSGIPGTVGAAPVQNIGAYGVEIKDTFLWADVYDMEQKKKIRMSSIECKFGYRTSVFKQTPGRFVVLAVAFALTKIPTPKLHYKDLATTFADTAYPTLGDIRNTVLNIRAQKFPDITKEGTAGSFFLNPIVSAKKAQELLAHYPELPHFSAPNGVKVSLAWMLDKGLGLKGYSKGRVRLYEKQPLVVVADKGATYVEVEEFTKEIQKKVQDVFAISIEPEVRKIF